MGSFNFVCAVSGLSIGGGTPVRYMLLTESPYNDNIRCYIHSIYSPRTFPLKAVYNDYGSVACVKNGVEKKAWMDGFQLDLVEKSWGENSCHDVPAKKNMSFDEMLAAVWEGRISVTDGEVKFDAKYFKDIPKKEIPAGVPTVERIEMALVSKKHTVHPNGDLVVEEEDFGQIRIRTNSCEPKDLEKAQETLSKNYATMLTRGCGPYSHGVELLVRPLPSVKDYHGPYKLSNAQLRKPLRVYQAMIREDVWQAICGMEIETWQRPEIRRLDHFVVQARTAYSLVAAGKRRLGLGASINEELAHALTFSSQGMFGDMVPFVSGIGTHFELIGRRFAAQGEKAKPKEIEAFVQTAGEYAFVNAFLSCLGYQWRPSYGSGPQCGDWPSQVKFTEAVAKIAKAIKKEQDEQ